MLTKIEKKSEQVKGNIDPKLIKTSDVTVFQGQVKQHFFNMMGAMGFRSYFYYVMLQYPFAVTDLGII